MTPATSPDAVHADCGQRTMFVLVLAPDCDVPVGVGGGGDPAHRRVYAVDEREVSRMFDMADCDGMEGVVQVLAIGNDGTLRPVTTGKQTDLDPDDESPGVYFATAPLVTDDGRRVGTVHYTDH